MIRTSRVFYSTGILSQLLTATARPLNIIYYLFSVNGLPPFEFDPVRAFDSGLQDRFAENPAKGLEPTNFAVFWP
jgi:hypothetical protein